MNDNSPEEMREEARAQPRKNLFLAATLFYGGIRSPVKVRNLSERGAMLESSDLPMEGQVVSLVRGSLAVESVVVWRVGNRCGLAFSASVSVSQWMAPAGNSEQSRVDQNVAMVRSGRAPPPTAPTAPSPMISGALAQTVTGQLLDDLGMAVRLLEDLGNDLVRHPLTVSLHGTKLQNIDLATQVLTAIAKAMAAQAEGRTVSLAQLNDLRTSCAEALRNASGH